MLSICIPVYNVDVSKLVIELNKQFLHQNYVGEIVVLDDGSNEHYRSINETIKQLEYVRYYLQENKGRSITRNTLARYARYSKIAFIDGDCLVDENYLHKYCAPNVIKLPLVIGGLKYGRKPKDKNLRLRWNYGRLREARIQYTADSLSFLSSNFMIDKTLFASIQFDERITEYGHEDTLLGIQLRLRQIPFVQIDNKVTHCGLETASIFISKTRESISNLWKIYTKINQNNLQKLLIIKILKKKQNKVLIKTLSLLFTFLNQPIQFYLSKIYPSIYIFDLYKLLYIYKLKHQLLLNNSL
ncbi:glycosyltransferase family 2 protein [Carboxylicivirga sp. RSCT41]|uniref:glycosyltransferase family 2 protein n=1 Tax=Carboxylicivirga agarovorans TaxID=3417570 RepID=UPI003D33ECF7